MPKQAIYLDYAATTPLDEAVLQAMLPHMQQRSGYANAASLHSMGQSQSASIHQAREQIARTLKCSADSIVFTSGATESNNIAILGLARYYQKQGKHIITTATEHKSILAPCAQLEREGFEVSYLPVQTNGLIDPVELEQAIRPDTLLISVAHVNSEIGVIQDILSIGKLASQHGILFHVDAAQSATKLDIDLSVLNIDALSISAHKLYGPKGVGALVVRQKPKRRFSPLCYGGGQEQGVRPGTLATHQIIGFARAMQISYETMSQEQTRIRCLRDRLWQGIKMLDGIHLNGDWDKRVSGNLNFYFDTIHGDSLKYLLNHLMLSSGASCDAATNNPSYVLKALGLPNSAAKNSIRLTLGRYTTEEDIDTVILDIKEAAVALQALSTFSAGDIFGIVRSPKVAKLGDMRPMEPTLSLSDEQQQLHRSNAQSLLRSYVEKALQMHSLLVPDENSYSATAGSKEAGNLVELRMQIVHDQIKCVSFKVYGDPFCMGACAYAADCISGKPLSAISDVTHRKLSAALSIPQTRQSSVVLVESAILSAVRQYKIKTVENLS